MKSRSCPLIEQYGSVHLRERVSRRKRTRGRVRVRGLHARVEHADRVHARIRAKCHREETATGLAHHRHAIDSDLALERRAVALGFRLDPVERGAQVVGVGLPRLLALNGGRCHHEKAMRGDRGEEASVARAVDGAPAVAPDHDGQRVARRERGEIGGTEDDVAGRAERRLRHDLVRPGLSQRRTFDGQRRRDHLARDAGRLRMAGSGDPQDGNNSTDNGKDLVHCVSLLDRTCAYGRRSSSAAQAPSADPRAVQFIAAHVARRLRTAPSTA